MAGNSQTRNEVIRELFKFPKNELPLKTNTPRSKFEAMVNMETVEYAVRLLGLAEAVKVNPNDATIVKNRKARQKAMFLSEKYREIHDIRMISVGGRNREELIKIGALGADKSPMPELTV